MKKFDVEHFLGLYKLRMAMQDDGITHPTEEGRKFTRDFVAKLSKMPLDEEVKVEGRSFIDSKGQIIATIPSPKSK